MAQLEQEFQLFEKSSHVYTVTFFVNNRYLRAIVFTTFWCSRADHQGPQQVAAANAVPRQQEHPLRRQRDRRAVQQSSQVSATHKTLKLLESEKY